MNLEIQYSLNRLRSAMQGYGVASGKDENEIVAKQSAKLGWNISRGLKKLAPVKGSIRESQLAALKSGHGVHVRDSVMQEIISKYGATTQVSTGKTFLTQKRGKRAVAMSTEIEKNGKMMNLQALAVERELNVRESARGFSGYSAPRPTSVIPETSSQERDIQSRYGFTLSSFSLKLDAETKFALLRWIGSQGQYESAVAGLLTPKQQTVLNEAIIQTTADIQVYIKRKQMETAKMFFN